MAQQFRIVNCYHLPSYMLLTLFSENCPRLWARPDWVPVPNSIAIVITDYFNCLVQRAGWVQIRVNCVYEPAKRAYFHVILDRIFTIGLIIGKNTSGTNRNWSICVGIPGIWGLDLRHKIGHKKSPFEMFGMGDFWIMVDHLDHRIHRILSLQPDVRG